MLVGKDLVNFQEQVVPDSLSCALDSNISHDGPGFAVLTHHLQAKVMICKFVCILQAKADLERSRSRSSEVAGPDTCLQVFLRVDLRCH